MNPSESYDLTMSTIAVVVQEPTDLPKLSEADLRPLLRSPLAIGPLATGELGISSSRDQIEVILSPAKINVKDLSGITDFSYSKVPDVLLTFFGWFKAKLKSYGINFILTVDIADPEVWIRDELLNDHLGDLLGGEVLRGSAKLSVRSDSKIWNIQFGRNPDSKLEINLNASEEADELPDKERLHQELAAEYAKLRNTLARMGLA